MVELEDYEPPEVTLGRLPDELLPPGQTGHLVALPAPQPINLHMHGHDLYICDHLGNVRAIADVLPTFTYTCVMCRLPVRPSYSCIHITLSKCISPGQRHTRQISIPAGGRAVHRALSEC